MRTMAFVHEYDERGNHRLRVQIFTSDTEGVRPPDIIGDWSGYQNPATVSVPFGGGGDRVFAAHTDFDTRFPLVYEVRQVAETIVVTNCGEETWRGTADQASNRSAITELKS